MFKSLIFDVDGTIADTESIVLDSLAQALREQGVEYNAKDLHFVLGIPSAITVKQFPVQDKAALLKRWAELEDAVINDAPVFEGWEEVFAALKQNNRQLGIVTSRLRKNFDIYMERINCQDLFSASFCYGETTLHKPHAEPMLACLEKLGVQACDALYIGDSIYDMQCAKNAGVAFALALWGAPSAKGFEQADYFLAKPQDILQFV